jgi:spore coat polysaccharide biosynthesis protein SpsF (cytidylyltransferase family)
MKKNKVDKGFRKFLKEAWALWKERQHTHRALRILNKQEWSVEFLTALLLRASTMSGKPLEMTIHGPNNVAFTVNTIDHKQNYQQTDDIFNFLDDDIKIKQFMESIR